MTDLEFEILKFIKDRRMVRWSLVLNSFDPETKINKVNSSLKNLLKDGLIEKTWKPERPPECTIKLTYDGILELSQAEANRPSADLQIDHQQHESHEPNQRNHLIKKVCCFVASAVAFLASVLAIIEYFGR